VAIVTPEVEVSRSRGVEKDVLLVDFSTARLLA